AKLGQRYIVDRFLPDKAIDLMDEAASKVRLKNSSLPPEAKELEKELKALNKTKEEAIRSQEFEKASKLRDKEESLKTRIRELSTEWKSKKETIDFTPTVTEDDITEVVASWTNIPVSKL